MITAALQSVVQEIRVSNLTQHVRTYHGEGTAKFYQWLADMDQLSNTIDSDRMCVLATLTLGGSAGLFVTRLTKTHITWTDLRSKLRERYGEAEDPRISQEKLKHIRQHKGEAVQNFAERLRAAATDVFNDIDSNQAQGVLVDTFQRGLRDDRLARVLIKKNLKTLDELEKEAVDEQQTDKIFNLYRREEEPMDVDVVKKDEVEELKKTVSDLEKKLARTRRAPPRHQNYPTRTAPPPPNAGPYTKPPPSYSQPPHMYTQPPPQTTPRRPPTQHRWTPDGRPVCSTCGRIGHVRRFCRSGN